MYYVRGSIYSYASNVGSMRYTGTIIAQVSVYSKVIHRLSTGIYTRRAYTLNSRRILTIYTLTLSYTQALTLTHRCPGVSLRARLPARHVNDRGQATGQSIRTILIGA